MVILGQHLITILEQSEKPNKEEFINLLKINLWGNKCDLSLSNGKINSNIKELFNLDNLQPNILCDHSERIWMALANNRTSDIIGEKWKNYVINNTWIIVENEFWTLPVDFTYMANTDPVLYKK
ncbi:UPF0364 protein C6orf211-like, partial [Asbolus verrucosus]